MENCCSIERAIADEMIRKSATSQKQGYSTKDEPNAPVIIDSFAERNIQILRRDEVIDQLESDISSEDIHFTLEGHNCPIIKSNEHPESSHREANIEPNMELIHQGLEPNTATQQSLEPNMALIQQGLEPNIELIQQGLEPNIELIQQGLEPNIELIQQGLEPNIELIQQGLEPDHINTQSREGSVKPPQLQICELGVVVEQLIDELIHHSLDVNLLTTEQCEHYSESCEQQHQTEPILFHAKPTEKAHQIENILVDLNSSEQTMSRKCRAEINIPKTEPNENALETSEHPPGIFNTEPNEHDLETSEHAPDISYAEPIGHKLQPNEHDLEQNVCNTEQNEHDLVPYEHALDQNEQDLVPCEHDLEPIEHDLEPNLCNAEPNTSNTGQLKVTGAIETGPRQNSSTAEQLNPSRFDDDQLEGVLSGAQAAGNDQGKEEVKNVIAQLIELSLDIHLSMTEQGGRKFHPSVSEPSELCPDKVSDFTEQNEDLLEKNNYVSHPTECVDLGLKSNENCPPRLKHKSINMRHVYPHRNVSNSSTTDCSLNTEQIGNNQHKSESEHNVTADALITKKQTESNLSAKEQSEHYPSATEQSEHNLKTAEQSADNPTSIDLSAAEDQPQTTDNKLL
ncbi:hypothetical protein SNE40_008376 [Patella caerulea]|uniref:Uncharacterized protein n=1 Tax=Patella caerulea TaxID=87958 RepID=A0AAN8JYQ8_PATCE